MSAIINQNTDPTSPTTFYRDDFADSGLIQEKSFNTTWGEENDYKRLAYLLESAKPMFSLNSLVRTKRPQWAIGDILPTSGVIGAQITQASTTVTLESTARFFAGTVLRFVDSDDGVEAIGKLTSAATSSDNTPNISWLTSGSFTIANASAYEVLATVKKHDTIAPNSLTLKGQLAFNHMQRSYETYGVGKDEAGGETYLARNDLAFQVEKGINHFQKTMNKSFYTQNVAIDNEDSDNEGVSGGFSYLLDAGNKYTSSDNPLFIQKGRNRVFEGSDITWNDMIEYSEYVFRFCGEYARKIALCSGSMYVKLLKMLNANVSIQTDTLSFLNAGAQPYFENPVVDFGFGEIMFMRDRGIDNTYMYVVDQENNSTTAFTRDWMLFIDPLDAGIINHDVKGDTRTFKLQDVDKYRNSDLDEVALSVSFSLAVKQPRVHGFFALAG